MRGSGHGRRKAEKLRKKLCRRAAVVAGRGGEQESADLRAGAAGLARRGCGRAAKARVERNRGPGGGRMSRTALLHLPAASCRRPLHTTGIPLFKSLLPRPDHCVGCAFVRTIVLKELPRQFPLRSSSPPLFFTLNPPKKDHYHTSAAHRPPSGHLWVRDSAGRRARTPLSLLKGQ